MPTLLNRMKLCRAEAEIRRDTGAIAAASEQIASDNADQVTQQNATLVEQVAAASESLREQSHALAAAVGVFKTGTAYVATALSAVGMTTRAAAASDTMYAVQAEPASKEPVRLAG